MHVFWYTTSFSHVDIKTKVVSIDHRLLVDFFFVITYEVSLPD